MSLDDHLAAWAATVRLNDADAEAIFRHIVLQGTATQSTATQSTATHSTGAHSTGAHSTGPARPAGRTVRRPRGVTAYPPAAASVNTRSAAAGLEPSWWRDYAKGFTARMVTSTRPVPIAA